MADPEQGAFLARSIAGAAARAGLTDIAATGAIGGLAGFVGLAGAAGFAVIDTFARVGITGQASTWAFGPAAAAELLPSIAEGTAVAGGDARVGRLVAPFTGIVAKVDAPTGLATGAIADGARLAG
mgnify:FL=1